MFPSFIKFWVDKLADMLMKYVSYPKVEQCGSSNASKWVIMYAHYDTPDVIFHNLTIVLKQNNNQWRGENQQKQHQKQYHDQHQQKKNMTE